jgi:outer membrane protein OmpA-like peptidoglycan-associated protein
MELAKPAPPENVVTPPVDAASLLEEIDLLAALPKDTPIDIKPDIKDAEYALQVKNPAIKGDPAAIAMKVSANLEVDTDLPEFGRTPEQLKPAEVGQVTVDPGAAQMDDKELGKYTDALIKRGANGNVEKGALDGIASLDALLDLPPNILLGKKTMLPSDLLFEFNSADLRESAKVGLMKLALLMDRNPNLYCWIEGHTDLVGGDEFNLDLSMRRAGSVKTYLTQSMRMDAARISTRGFGRYEPLVIRGTAEEQALNRRVEIRMRKTPPPKDQLKITPKKAAVIEHAPPPKTETTPPPPKGLPIKPKGPPPWQRIRCRPAPNRHLPGRLPSLTSLPCQTCRKPPRSSPLRP